MTEPIPPVARDKRVEPASRTRPPLRAGRDGTRGGGEQGREEPREREDVPRDDDDGLHVDVLA